MNDVKITENTRGDLTLDQGSGNERITLFRSEAAALEAHYRAKFAAERVTLTDDKAVEKIARVMALVDDYDGCFERIDEWEALPDWEKEAHPDEEPLSDREDAEFWMRRARAVVAALAAEQPATPTRLDPDFRADLVDFARERIQAVWNDVPEGVDAATLASNIVAAQEFCWMSRQAPVQQPATPTPSTEQIAATSTLVTDLNKWANNLDQVMARETLQGKLMREAASVLAQYEADAIQRSEEGRTDWDYQQRIDRLEGVIARARLAFHPVGEGATTTGDVLDAVAAVLAEAGDLR